MNEASDTLPTEAAQYALYITDESRAKAVGLRYDGSVEFRGVTPDEASRLFWDSMGREMIVRAAVLTRAAVPAPTADVDAWARARWPGHQLHDNGKDTPLMVLIRDVWRAARAAVPAVQTQHWPILYAILRPAITSGNEAVRQHAERLAEVLDGDQRTALRELLDRPARSEEPARVVHSASGEDAAAKEVPPGRWKVGVPDGIYGNLPGDPPGPCDVRKVVGGYVYLVTPRTGELVALSPPTVAALSSTPAQGDASGVKACEGGQR